MRILVTAFDPFGGDDTNSSMLTLECIKDKIDDIEIKKIVIPTEYTECARIAWDEAVKFNADAILSLGQAGGRGAVTVEVIGINYAHAEMKDNRGVMKTGERLFENGEAAFYSTLPVGKMVERAQKGGFKANLSVSAGGFVCNSLLYTLLKNAKDEGRNIRVGFVHLPYEEGQGKSGFSMKSSDMALCVEEMIKAIKNSERI
ncbi:MAG: pyroglutamyl-peptidase I [Clostridia bacterium]|nr:pyroglutamyl-peptidase I [Clostridia bacterium]